MFYFCYSRAGYVPAHLLLGGHYRLKGGGDIFSQEILSLCHPEAVCRVSISYYACNWSKSLWCGVVVWWLKPTLVFSLAQAEQYQTISNHMEISII